MPSMPFESSVVREDCGSCSKVSRPPDTILIVAAETCLYWTVKTYKASRETCRMQLSRGRRLPFDHTADTILRSWKLAPYRKVTH